MFLNAGTIGFTGLQSAKTTSDEIKKAMDYIGANQLQEAVDTLEQTLRQNGNNAEAWQTLGTAFYRQGKIENALKAYQKAASLQPDLVMAHTGLAACFLTLEKLKEAEKEVGVALKLNPKSDEAHYFQGVIRLKSGDAENAVNAADRALEINPSFGAALALKNQALIEIFSRVIDPKIRIDRGFQKEQALILLNYFGFAPDLDNAKRLFKLEQGDRFNHAIKVFEKAISNSTSAKEVEKWKYLLDSMLFWKPWVLDYDDKPLFSDIIQLKKVTEKPIIITVPKITGFDTQTDIYATVLVMLTNDGDIRYPLFTLRPGNGLSSLILAITDKIKISPAAYNGQKVATIAILRFELEQGKLSVGFLDNKD